jgi:hypothetical protein
VRAASAAEGAPDRGLTAMEMYNWALFVVIGAGAVKYLLSL